MSTPRAQALQARRAALRATLAERRAAAQAALAKRRATLPRKPERRRRWWVILLALLLLLLLRDCQCQDEPVLPPVPAPAAAPPPPAGGAAAPSTPPPGQVARKRRPAFTPASPEPLPWIAALRLQIAARSPRLAACFVGAPRPGALRWSAAVDPSQGQVSDQTLEPTVHDAALTAAQRDCVFQVLSEPPYSLDADLERSTPARVALVVEF